MSGFLDSVACSDPFLAFTNDFFEGVASVGGLGCDGAVDVVDGERAVECSSVG